jgi:hypothetical protein
MPSKVTCDNGHKGGRCRQAAIGISANNALGNCSCGAQKRYLVTQFYPFYSATHEYEVVQVRRINNNEVAEAEGYDPMVFLLRDRENGSLVVWPFYWIKNRHGRWHVGQFPPLLPIEPLRQLLADIESSNRRTDG